MSGKSDIAKGRIKEAAGELTGNDDLVLEGQADQAVGETKEGLKRGVRKIKRVILKGIDRI